MPDRMKIVLDPGHGGNTEIGGSSPNNATGPAPRQLKEKDLTLQLASALEQRLRNTCDVFLTRTGDTNLSLADRAAVARTHHADLFLSIHFNGFSDPSVDGTEVWVAQHAAARSRSFAQTVLDRLVLITGVANRGVRERNLGVLLPARHDPGTAACLAEVSFLTNPRQAARLEDPLYLGHIADALAEAVRAQAPVAVAHAVTAGPGSGTGDGPALASPSLSDPDPVDDERYSAAMSTQELERLYALPLETVIKTVVDGDARIRGGPPDFALGQRRIPRWTKVRVEEVNGNYSRVTGLDATAYGWTASTNLATFFKDNAALVSAALAPATALTIDSSWPEIRKAVARTFNRLGGLMQTIATQTRTDLASILAVWYVESGGRTHTTGQAVIRFENHLLFDQWGSQHAADFDQHFQFGTRAPQTGATCDQRWKCHRFRAGSTGNFEDLHTNQDSEYRALAAATALCGETIAIHCISIGGSQILGSNYRTIGYDTPRQMYDAFQANERAHVLGFFDYCQFVRAHGALLDALRHQNWRDFASGYNGSSRVDRYSTDLQNAAQAATAVLAARPAGAQALEVSLGNESVDLHYQVHLIPQPDKKSCWAASMAMLVSYYRQASVTPESLAHEVGGSLRTSYDWGMLRRFRQHFIFKEVSLPSNLSFVPPPADWHQWLSQFGPLWVTVTGDPSHAVVVAGISGDLTPSGTYVHVLNPWDDRVRFDNDQTDFHPDNNGREDTHSFDDFSRMFGNMGLGDYGHWRVLYLGLRPTQAQELDIRSFTPEELAGAELPHAHVSELEAVSLGRPALGLADVRWADDNKSIDYRHLGAAGVSSAFAFTPALLERLCTLNRFDVAAGQDEVLFALRGCEILPGGTPTGFVNTAQLSETMPDHQNARCVLGVWKRSTRQFSLFPGSTVPNWTLMELARQSTGVNDHANMLPTGRYLYKIGTHHGKHATIRGAFREAGPAVVLRTDDNLIYEIGDRWDSGEFGDNIHPAFLDRSTTGPRFSSAGCQTIPGNVNDGGATGTWADFRTAAGLSPAIPASEDGRRFVYVLLTGRDARLIAEGIPDNRLMRLRFGSSGPDVTGAQIQLGDAGHLTTGATGLFDPSTKMAYIAWQRARNAATADGVVTPSDGASLGIDMIHGQSIAITHSLEEVEVHQLDRHRAPTNDEIIQQLDSQQGASYGNYAGYRATLVNGTLFGHGISEVTPGFLRKLQQGQTDAARAIGGASPNFGIVSAHGFRASEGMHNWGLAVDLNYDSCPYIMHSAGEAALDAELSPVYERVARFMLQRASVIPRDITEGARSAARTSTLYDRLLEESNAMIQYFHLMQDTSRLASALQAMPANTNWQPISGSAAAPSADALRTQMMTDYTTLAGRGGPAIAGQTYPTPRTINRSSHGRADRPFETRNPALRAPELGFLSIRKEVVIALSNAGLRWGAIDFGAESGDVMHFDDRLGEGAKIMRAKAAAAAVIAASSQSLQVTAAACAADIPIDERTALIFSNEAPLADRSDCDYKAVWCFVPAPPPRPFSVLFYFHGNDACVTVDGQHPGGRLPSWNRIPNPNVHRLTPNGPFTPGLKYDIAGAVQASAQHPVVLIPEDGVPDTWAKTDAGRIRPDRAALSRLIDDAWGHLATLNRPSGSPYLSGGPRCPDIRRAFLSGHSGGGKILGPAASSSVATGVPTDLWLLDCTYAFGVEDHYINFCQSWKARGHLGNDAQSSRMVVIVWTASNDTTNGAGSILQRLRAAWRDSGGSHPGFNAVRFSQHKFCPLSGNCPAAGITPAAGTEIVEVMQDAGWTEIDDCLRRFPVVFIHTGITHDEIPLRYFPHLLSTAAVP